MTTVIFDIEASCDDHKISPYYNMETIEIGAVKVYQGKIVDTFETFVRPEYISSLTTFCKELTGIKDEDLKGAPEFAEAILDFFEFIYGSKTYSCGEFDRKFLVRELADKGNEPIHNLVSNSINSSHTDLKRLFSQVTGKKKQGMIAMAGELGVELTGDHHRALSDAQNLANIYLELERIRERELAKVFSENKMARLIKAMNEHHYKYTATWDKGNYITLCEEGKPTKILKFIEFMDSWSDIMITDVSERRLDYISELELSAIRRYTR